MGTAAGPDRFAATSGGIRRPREDTTPRDDLAAQRLPLLRATLSRRGVRPRRRCGDTR